jgi:hypothetical protein
MQINIPVVMRQGVIVAKRLLLSDSQEVEKELLMSICSPTWSAPF